MLAKPQFPKEAQISEEIQSGFLYKIKHLFRAKGWVEYEALPPKAFPVNEDLYEFSFPLIVRSKQSQTLLTATVQGPPIDGLLRWEADGKPIFHAGEQKQKPEQVPAFKRGSLVTCENGHVVGRLKKPIYTEVPRDEYEAKLAITLAEGQRFQEIDNNLVCSECQQSYTRDEFKDRKTKYKMINVDGVWGPDLSYLRSHD